MEPAPAWPLASLCAAGEEEQAGCDLRGFSVGTQEARDSHRDQRDQDRAQQVHRPSPATSEEVGYRQPDGNRDRDEGGQSSWALDDPNDQVSHSADGDGDEVGVGECHLTAQTFVGRVVCPLSSAGICDQLE
jgi:hypothetical protein